MWSLTGGGVRILGIIWSSDLPPGDLEDEKDAPLIIIGSLAFWPRFLLELMLMLVVKVDLGLGEIMTVGELRLEKFLKATTSPSFLFSDCCKPFTGAEQLKPRPRVFSLLDIILAGWLSAFYSTKNQISDLKLGLMNVTEH